MSQRAVIVGAGPCGLACARELEALGHTDWVVLEAGEEVGGLAASIGDPQGFTWDMGGHVVFSHFGEFDALLDDVMGDEVLQHDRSSHIRFRGSWVPYPFQNNLHRLSADDAYDCLVGLVEAKGIDGVIDPSNLDFAAWIDLVFGAGIAERFMRPYNAKVWATPLHEMSAGWIADRVSVIDYRAALRSIVHRTDDVGWGPNNTFAFPAHGGTGAIYRRLAQRLGDRIRLRSPVVRIDAESRCVRLADGMTEAYDVLVSTVPLDRLVGMLVNPPAALAQAAGALVHNSVFVVGVGYESPLRDDRSWLYFPEDDVPFYRVTNFAKYSPHNVPGGDTERYCSFMTEIAHSSTRPVEREGLVERVDAGLRAAGLVPSDAEVVSRHVIDLPYAYPVPTLGRDAALEVIQRWLDGRGILSRGRFGTWRYEIGNMDHAVKMGVDAARRIVLGESESLIDF